MKSIFLNKISNIVLRFSSMVSELFSVIRGPRPANLDCRIISGNDGHRGRLFSSCKFFNYPSPDTTVSTSPARGEVLNNITFKGLDVVRQYAALLERRVQSSRRVRKAQAVTRQTNPIGRSMIEMLGVLAIIGVLSVAGIAGYSKAMTKWKINQTIEQIEQITHNTFTAFANQKEMDELSSNDEDNINLLKSLGIISEDMIGDRFLKNPFGGDLLIITDTCDSSYHSHSGKKLVSFEYDGISREACMALGSLNWENGSAAVVGIGLSSVGAIPSGPSDCLYNDPIVNISDGKRILFCNHADKSSEEYTSFPIPPDIVAKYCNCSNNDCYFSVSFTDK